MDVAGIVLDVVDEVVSTTDELVDELEVDVLSATSEVDVPVPGLAESSLPLVSSTTTAPITAARSAPP